MTTREVSTKVREFISNHHLLQTPHSSEIRMLIVQREADELAHKLSQQLTIIDLADLHLGDTYPEGHFTMIHDFSRIY